MGIRCADHVTPLYPQKLALASLTGGGRSVGQDPGFINASTNVSINDNENDEFSEGVSEERQVKENLGTKKQIKYQKEALHLEKRKIKLMEERLMKKPQADKE